MKIVVTITDISATYHMGGAVEHRSEVVEIPDTPFITGFLAREKAPHGKGDPWLEQMSFSRLVETPAGGE